MALKSFTTTVKKTTFRIWPNPVRNQLTFESSLFAGEQARISIFDSKGQVLFRTTKTLSNGAESIKLPAMSAAMYYLQVISKDHSAATGFIKIE